MYIYFIAFLIVVTSCIPLNSNYKKDTGKICGTVKAYSENLPESNIYVQNTYWSSTANTNGYYCIENILPGEYTVSAQSFGYYQFTLTKVKVLPYKTSIVNFELINHINPEPPYQIWEASYKNNFQK